MKNSKMMIDVVTKNGVVVIAKGSVDSKGVMTVDRETVEIGGSNPAQTNVMAFVGKAIADLTSQGYKERICVILPEQTVLRGAQALKMKKSGTQNIGDALFQGWMANRNDEKDAWITACQIFGAAIERYEGDIIFVNARWLYRWEIKGSAADGSDLVPFNGKEITFVKGAAIEEGLVNSENPYYGETGKLTVTKIVKKDGKVTYRGFVPRMITAQNSDGETVRISAFEASDFTKALSADDRTTAVINALRLHVMATAKLPKLIIANSVVVNDH